MSLRASLGAETLAVESYRTFQDMSHRALLGAEISAVTFLNQAWSRYPNLYFDCQFEDGQVYSRHKIASDYLSVPLIINLNSNFNPKTPLTLLQTEAQMAATPGRTVGRQS
jgi:hypothetical protein